MSNQKKEVKESQLPGKMPFWPKKPLFSKKGFQVSRVSYHGTQHKG